jgi:hypothetical protein
MDPYLEAHAIWPSLHTRFMTMFADLLTPQLAPNYIADLETQIVIDRIDDDTDGETHSRKGTVSPDVAVMRSGSASDRVVAVEESFSVPLRLRLPMTVERRLTTLRILRSAGETLVSVIELLSPVNKRPGQKRRDYLAKRATYIESSVHFIEIDLFRRWPRMPLEGPLPPCDYLVLVSDANERPDVVVWPVSVRQPLPVIPVPLLPPDAPVCLDLGEALRTVYARARYDLRVDYTQPPEPPLSPDDAVWAAGLTASG